MNDSDSFFGSAKTEERESRPRAVNPRTGQEQSWQRASNYAAPLDNPHGLIKWQLRELVKGISMRPDLARMLLTGAAIEDNAKADEIIATAHAVAGTSVKANEGTAVHAALSRSFLGHEIPAEYVPHVSAFAAELKRNGLEPRVTEVTLFNTQLGAIGHVDWIVKTADGRFVVLDVKTGKLGDAKRKFAVQCKAYAGADYMTGPDVADSKTPVPVPWQVDQTEAILAHVDPETGATALYRIDLVLGFYGATLAERVRDWHKIEVLSPYVPVHHAVPTGNPASGQVTAPAKASPEVDRDAQWRAVEQLGLDSSAEPREQYSRLADVTEDGEYVVNEVRLATLTRDARHPAEIEAAGAEIVRRAQQPQNQVVGRIEVTEPRPTSAHDAIAVGEALNASVDAEKAELLKLDKAALQVKAKNEHGATDLAHNREWLACYIIARRHGCDEASAVMYAKSKGTMKIGTAASFSRAENAHAASPRIDEQGVTQRPSTEPERQAGDLSFIFKSIEGARSEGAIEALRANVVERRGDQAWTDEMAAAAQVRVSELLAASGNAVGPVERMLARITQATEPAHIAALWSEATIGGSVPENWSEPLKLAADRRMAEIQAAQPPMPANPYVQQ